MAGRRERPLDPEAGPVARFARDLRGLRSAAGGMTYRRMARLAGYSVSTLASAAAGRQLPSLPVTLAYARACGGDPDEWAARWHRADRAALEPAGRAPDEGDGANSPYRGLARYETGDRSLFFGRDQLIDRLGALLTAHRFVILTGASGCGKSSLLRAGLIPLLRTPGGGGPPCGAVRVLTPGPRPAATHARALVPRAGTGPGAEPAGDTVVIVDQFEEVFTLCRDPAERARFLGMLTAAREPGSGLRVVAAVRADFYGHCTEHPDLIGILREAHLPVGPMTPAELRQAVVGPARSAGLIVERELTARIVGETAGEPGALPLMSHALLEIWRRRRGRTLTLAAYEAVGGVHGAVADTAERAWASFGPARAAHARRILLRLISPGRGAQDTRRPAHRAELAADGSPEAGTALEHLTRARLVTLDGDTVDLAHEALITAWPRLRGWIAEDREGLGVHRRLTEAATAWAELDRDEGALYRGTRLAVAREWAERNGNVRDLNPVERDFLHASAALRDSERLAARGRDRRQRRLSATLAVLLMLVTGGGVALFQQREQAVVAQREALSRQLASQALALADARPSTAMLLSVEAYRTARTREARGALLSMSARRAHVAELPGHRGPVSAMAFGPGGLLAGAGGDRTLTLWDTGERTRLAALTAHRTRLRTVAFSPDGRLIATGGDDRRVVVWDTARRAAVGVFGGHRGEVAAVGFTPDGRLLASADTEGKVLFRESPGRGAAASGVRLALNAHSGAVRTLAFSPDGRLLATGGDDRTVRLWNTATGRLLARLTGHARPVHTVAFASDGRTLASGGRDHTVRLWDTRRGVGTALLDGHRAEVRSVAFGPDGRTLASGGHDGTVILWDAPHRTRRATLTGHGGNVHGLGFHRRSPLLAVAGETGRITLWNTAQTPLAGHRSLVNRIAFSPDGTTVATAGHDRDGALWDVARRERRATLPGGAGPVRSVAFSPDGRTLAAVLGVERIPAAARTHRSRPGDGAVLLWSVGRSGPPMRLRAGTGRLADAAFSPDGRTLAAGGDIGIVLWDPVRGTRRAVLGPGRPTAHGVAAVAFSPDGRLIAGASRSGRVTVWDVRRRVPAVSPAGHAAGVTSVAFSPDGRTLATASRDQTVRLWDVRSGRQRAVLTGGRTYAVAFSPDGRTLATATADSSVVLWDTGRRTPLATLTGHQGQVRTLAFSPDGGLLASAGNDGTVRLWNTDPERTERQLCGALALDPVAEERRLFLSGLEPRRTCAPR
ncbi:hypothetical protein [Streptomyces sp. CAU 1734]|uniref:nSTAND1 domain-containing NTPase n=1 Tax=Streptomyces sp. CAU 1734 TaxID=3140360 RepID=UPI003260FDF8